MANVAATTLTGTVTRITFRNEDTGYTVLRMDTTNAPKRQGRLALAETTVVGVFSPAPQEHEEMTMWGNWTSHPKFGEQFKADRVATRAIAQNSAALEAYLSSGLFHGIGPAKAAAIVAVFGEATGTIITTNPSKLAEVKGISEEMAMTIGEEWRKHETARETMTWLCGYGLSTAIATRIYKVYGDETIERVSENPYRLAADVDGIGFLKADEIARVLLKEYRPDLPYRVRSGVVHVLREARNEGHVYLPYGVLVSRAQEVLHIPPQSIQTVLDGMPILPNSEIVIDETPPEKVVYTYRLHEAERLVAHQLKLIAGYRGALDDLKPDLDAKIAEAEAKLTFKLTDQQRQAVRMALSSKVSVITGGPGVGKSTILKLVTDVLQQADKTFALASPTGRAAKRLGEATLQFARTIHRLLEFTPDGGFQRNTENPIYADMIVIDEASMLDLSLFHCLLKATSASTHLLIVGDPDQLPSVGAGDVLHDLIRSQKFPVSKLDHIFRQAKGSSIITNAHLINAGKMPSLDMKPDWVFVEAAHPLMVQQQIVELVCNKLPAKGFDPVRDVQVLLPMYKGDAGVNELNQLLRNRLNPPKGPQDRKFRPGDKVMQLKNNYQLDVFNGDTGFVQEWDADEAKLIVEIDGRRVGYESSMMDQLTLAYACTIHKSQGSEYPVVIVGLSSAHFIMLKRNLLYTGITRGKQVVVLVGDKRSIGMAVSHADTAKRYTRLVSRLNG